MPWRGPAHEGEFPSLGWEVAEWISKFLRVPDGPFAGQPLELTDEQLSLLVRWYGIDDRGRWLFRRACKRAAQGWGKSPFLGAIALVELAGPCRFDGWDSSGDPVAIRSTAPWVQIAAVSEDQTDNTYAAAYAMASESELVDTTIDIGLTRMYLRGETGRLEPVTASAGSRLGQRITFAVLDETHLWTSRNGGRKLAATIRRNAGKMGGRTFESTNAHQIGEGSVAEATWEASHKGAPGLLYEAFEAPTVDDLHDQEAVRYALTHAYQDSIRWVPIDRIVHEIADPSTDPNDTRRFYFNQLTSGGDCPFDMLAWRDLAASRPIADGERVALGFDGSISDDKTTLYGCTVEGNHVFRLAVWARPPDAPPDWTVPRHEVHDAVRDAFARWKVQAMFCDPPLWRTELEDWARLYGEDTVVAFPTNQARRFAPACDRFASAIRTSALTHDGSESLTHDLGACARKQVRLADDPEDRRTSWVIVKSDARKIDEAVAAILALEAAAFAATRAPESAEAFALWG